MPKARDAYDPDIVLAEIAEFLRETGITEGYFGRLAVNNSRVVRQLPSGGVTLRTVKRLRAYMAQERTARARYLARERARLAAE